MKTPSFRLDGRRALVTGGSRGVGLAAAHALAQAGAEVVLAARDSARLAQACASIAAEGGRASACELDLTRLETVSPALAALCAQRPFDVLVNCAGTNRPALLAETNDEDVRAVMELNVHATFAVTRFVTQVMRRAGRGGSVINVSSQMGHVGGPRRTVYCASKHALEGFTKALAWELGPDRIRVNTLCPTFVETELTAPMFERAPAFRQACIDRIALGRLGTLEDLMGAFVFLASDASALVTGTALMVDGGWTAV